MSNLQTEQQRLEITDFQKARRLISVLASEYSVELLQELHTSDWAIASEIARSMGIHTATAMRKLAELVSLKIVKKRTRKHSRYTEYKLASPRLEIVLDFEQELRSQAKRATEYAEMTYVKEKSDSNILVESDNEERRVLRLIFAEGRKRRKVARTMELTELEGRFMWHLPFSSQRALSIADVCQAASIKNPLYVVKISEFVREMERLGVIDIIR